MAPWGSLQSVVGESYYFVSLVLGFGLFFCGFHALRRWWRSGRSVERSGRRLERLASLVRSGFGQKEVLRDRWAGLAHVGLLVGFLVPLLVVLAVQVPFSAPTRVSNILGLVLDLSGVFGIAGVLALTARKVVRARSGRPSPVGDWVVLGILLAVFVSGFILGSARVSVLDPEDAAWTPVRLLLSQWGSLDPVVTHYMWRLHFLLVVGLFAFMPYGRLRHAVTAPLNIYHRDLGPKGAMQPLALERDRPFGAFRRQEFTWNQLLDAQACMACGRCDEQCPAAASGKPLSPKKIMQDLGRLADGNGLIGEYVSDDEIWACTTCHACQTACPVSVEHPQTIMDVRRHLVLTQSRFPPELKSVFRKLDTYGDPYGKGPARRTEWAKNLKVKSAVGDGPAEYLLWIGCEGAFHARYREVSASLVAVLAKAGLDFAVLGKEEGCCGDLPRRMGNEYLFRQLAERNMEALHRIQASKVITLCPHCFHALKNEYPQLGGHFDVFHSAEVLADLLRQGRLAPEVPFPRTVTYHDPCYLGRINGRFHAPREVLGAIPELNLVEMERSMDKGFCCGAGGGRGWMHEHLGKRINRMRAEEAAALGTERVVTSCPYCLSMFEDGLGSMEAKNLPGAVDLVELLLQSLR
jgi:Fe-S oxidoreductase/nitrate reductase gamma subunit